MPEQERQYGTKITALGASRIAACILNGERLKITQAAAGDGGGSYYVPAIEQTQLMRELWRGPVVSAVQNPDVPNMLDVKVVIDDSVGNFVCREMGLFSEDGTLIALCNTPDTEKVAISTGVDGRLTMVMHIVVADSSVLEFNLVPSLDIVNREDLDRAIAEHNRDTTAHTDIYQAIPDALSAHNADPEAHPAIRLLSTALDARLSMLELMYSTDVSGNPFTVTFESLDGLKVTGVWNVLQQRIEF